MAKPANLLFIISDEHTRDITGCYGHPLVQTPNIDALAEKGVRFQNAYTNCPICVPARASLATGQYVNQIGYWDNAHPYEGEVKGWGHCLIEAGHRVESIGKLHYRDDKDEDGFSKHTIPLNVVGGIGDPAASIRDEPIVREGTREGITGAGPGDSTYLRYDVDIAEKSCEWLQQRAEEPDEKPWVLFASFVCPHPPFVAPRELYERYPLEDIPLPVQGAVEDWPRHPALEMLRKTLQYDEPFTEEQIRNVTAAYYGACTHLDLQIGKVLSALSEHGFDENTRIIYTSDHGESMGSRGLWGKFTMYEESAAVPFVVAGPDVPQGEVAEDCVSLVDCYQTILDCVGLELTESEENLPGQSLWPIAQGQSSDRVAFSEYHAVGSTSASYLLRKGQHKLIYYVGQDPQLFDLEADPKEMNDLSKSPEHQAVLQDLEAELRKIVDPEEADRQAKADQEKLIESFGGPEALKQRGSFVNSPAPGETPVFHSK